MQLKIGLILAGTTLGTYFVTERTLLLILGAILTVIAVLISRLSLPAARV